MCMFVVRKDLEQTLPKTACPGRAPLDQCHGVRSHRAPPNGLNLTHEFKAFFFDNRFAKKSFPMETGKARTRGPVLSIKQLCFSTTGKIPQLLKVYNETPWGGENPKV